MALIDILTSVVLAAASTVTASISPTESAPPAFRPFGVAQDSLPSALGCKPIYGDGADTTGQYTCSSLPGGSDLYDQYVLAYVQGMGICNVVAVSRYINDDQRGTTTRQVYKEAASLLASEFGPADEKVDHAARSKYGKDGMFRDAVVAQERQVFEQWDNLSAKYKNAQSASVTISGSDELGLAVYSIFRFAHNDQCLSTLQEQTGLSGDQGD
ncbi:MULTISPECIES: hypothetical protein [unclassified Rhizobium]|uniref:hypothetical protein n=1 Tax=unclassified Rhizobium TaxID=2613769 RepID=UPI00161B0E16|nr:MULTISPECIES: hypothetical protein [unclassified Rhizobium]MBB3317982.1 hypothetical protein [Rhizobium sp. BK181]MBB3544289.1 hypothetical protein [Rhizobium sp. BK399]MCS3742870.1 hypothetical protein [Rhizobium sp. BK661]MCS4095116.1 hypothetical protein [Rhizobium sp. BK176]